MNLQELKIKKPPELLAFAEEQGVEGAAMMRRQELMFAILQKVAAAEQAIFGTGTIEVLPDGFGYLRSMEAIPAAPTTSMSARPGRKVGCRRRHGRRRDQRAKDGERIAMVQINKINFDDHDALRHRSTSIRDPLYPDRSSSSKGSGAAVMAPAVKEGKGARAPLGQRQLASHRHAPRSRQHAEQQANLDPRDRMIARSARAACADRVAARTTNGVLQNIASHHRNNTRYLMVCSSTSGPRK